MTSPFDFQHSPGKIIFPPLWRSPFDFSASRGGKEYEPDPFEFLPNTEVRGPFDLLPQRGRFSPLVIMLMGRRGSGKSYFMTALAWMAAERFMRWRFGAGKVAANYKLMLPRRHERRVLYGQMLLDWLLSFPPEGHDLAIHLDEIQQYIPSRRSMATANVTFSSGFLTMIRKLRCDVTFSTQFPQVIDYQALLQVDLFIEVRSSHDMHHLDLVIWDWWGQYTGRNYRKQWPPRLMDADLLQPMEIPRPQRIFKMYDTEERIPPIFLPGGKREEIIERQYAAKGWDETQGQGLGLGSALEEMEKAEALVEREGLPERAVVTRNGAEGEGPTLNQEEKFLALFPDVEFRVQGFVAKARDLGIARGVNDLSEWLRAHRFSVVKQEGRDQGYWARKE